MKVILWILGGLVALILAFGALQYAASERVEVVLLHTLNDQGEQVTTRLWIVDHDGHPYLRGDSGSGWFNRVQSSQSVSLTRNGETLIYSHQLRNDNLGAINRLMREKYTWGDQLVTLMGGGDREHSNAIELTLLRDITVAPGRRLKATPVFDAYWTFAAERQRMFMRRVLGSTPPWTNDPVFEQYRFTNTYRVSFDLRLT